MFKKASKFVIDVFSGTGTGACLYALKRIADSRVVCIDMECGSEFLKQYVPKRYWHRVVCIQQDVRRIDPAGLLKNVKKAWSDFSLHKIVWAHASPSCRTYSRADRGLSKHRDGQGRPMTARAREDDKAAGWQ